MTGPSYGDKDPIAAPATPLAESALALIRTSGQGAIDILAKIFSRPEKLISSSGNSVIHGWIVDPANQDEKIDEVLVTVYRSSRSYSGEDMADISCHGGIAAVKAVMACLKKAGFRPALPGEFTFRAFMNGKMDLTRAESVMELVSAKTNRGREQAIRRLTGLLEKEILEIKDLLVELLAGAEIYLDYSEDEFLDPANDEEAGRLPSRKLAEEAAGRLAAISDLWRRERIYAEGALAVIAGRPNAGKSSLFNYLLREDRSIVTNVPGTTRDWIEAVISVEDIPLRLADTAGLREIPQAEGDEAERIGMRKSMELLDRADLVLYIIDGVKGITKDDRNFIQSRKEAANAKPLLVLWNKSDLSVPPSAQDSIITDPIFAISAKSGEGIQNLVRSIVRTLEKTAANPETLPENSAGPGTARQKELIDTALNAVTEALALADAEEPLDIIAPLFRSAVNALGEITGEISSDDILEAMFSRFCVGK